MGYVGNQQTEGFSQVPAKQDLTGATGTSLTLSHAVASAEGIDLFINNVRQEPTEAYSVVGTAVTLTGSVVATDDIYVVYNSLARQTSTHPSNQALQATSGTFSGAVSVASATVTGDLTVAAANNEGTVRVGGHSTYYGEIKRINASDEVRIGSYGASQNMTFYTVGSERMRIDSSGNLLVGKTSGSDTTVGCHIEPTYGGYKAIAGSIWPWGVMVNRQDNDGSAITLRRANTTVGSITVNSSSTSYNTSSDYRLKENVTADWNATTRLKQLNPVRFNFIADADTTVDGFLAHEVQTVVPEAIGGTKDEVDDDGNPVYQGIDQSKLVPLLVKTIQELEARITALEAS